MCVCTVLPAWKDVMEKMRQSGLIEALGLFSVPLLSSSVFALLFSRAVGEQRGEGNRAGSQRWLLTGAVWQSGTQFLKAHTDIFEYLN